METISKLKKLGIKFEAGLFLPAKLNAIKEQFKKKSQKMVRKNMGNVAGEVE